MRSLLPLLAALPGTHAFVPSQTCPQPGLSCPAPGYVNTCCTNTPGGQFALTQFWNSDPRQGPRNPGYIGPATSWTIHGMWPDHCDGTFDSVCDCARSGDCSSRNRKCGRETCNRDYSSVTRVLERFGKQELLEYMRTYWRGINGDENLWQHEWSKHGTCVSTLEPKCYANYEPAREVVDYFDKAVQLFKNVSTYEWLAQANIVPSTTKTYTLNEILAALTSPRGVKPVVGCQGGELREVWFHFHTKGSMQAGEFVAIDPDFSGAGPNPGAGRCPHSGIRYLPKEVGGYDAVPAGALGSEEVDAVPALALQVVEDL
ncbi:ribonuclease T2 [Trichodelitschia bisporula]|uniref:ribonuclease T2 n=1 Tax=Trichodelitschia bisporula TaxID=703511 RepID=A0A6G1HWR7_9PEZI|nr:ribonuclease T2 [Trichodelitschia bisporula]